MADPNKPSAVEIIKGGSKHLRGTIADELASGSDHFEKDTTQLLKFHGFYQQDDRDTRKERRAEGKGKEFIFMVRTAIPGGKLTSEQFLAELDLCDELGNTTLRITTRQGLQLHGVKMGDVRETIQRINQVQLTTLAACGDVERNVMCCPGPHHNSPVHDQMQKLASDLAAHLQPRSRAYHELWLQDPETGEKELVGGGSNGKEVEPIYGDTYLPRKFKTAIGLPEDNCIDIYTHDLGLLAVTEGDQIIGYNVLVGGGQGVTPTADKTFPALAKRLCFATPEQVIDVATAIVKVQRDFGNRSDRKVARMKYLINDWGLEKFKAKVEEYYGQALPEPHPADVHGFDDHIGWREQGDGRFYYGLNVENGRILDNEQMQLKTALRQICTELKPGIRLTAHQSLIFTDLAEGDRSRLEETLRGHGVPLSEDISTVRRWSMACVAWPTCGLAVTESERALPGVIDDLEAELAKLGLDREAFTVRMTGCPNGCARPYNSDIGLVGRTLGKYTVFVGGALLGHRLNQQYKDLVELDQIVPTLVPLFVYYKQDRQPNETFGDFCDRIGVEQLQAFADQYVAAAG